MSERRIAVTGGTADRDRIVVQNDGEPYPRVLVTSTDGILVGDGTSPPVPLAANPGSGGVGGGWAFSRVYQSAVPDNAAGIVYGFEQPDDPQINIAFRVGFMDSPLTLDGTIDTIEWCEPGAIVRLITPDWAAAIQVIGDVTDQTNWDLTDGPEPEWNGAFIVEGYVTNVQGVLAEPADGTPVTVVMPYLPMRTMPFGVF